MRVLFFLVLITLLAACSNSSSVPSDIIPGKKMETILWQLMQSDEYVNRLLVKDSLKKNNTERMKIYQQVFDLNGTSLNEFKKSYQFYMAHPDITKVMFDSINVKAQRQRAEMYKTKTVLPLKPPVKLPIKPLVKFPVKSSVKFPVKPSPKP